MSDLAGGRVSVGAAGSGTEQMSRQILEAYGFSYDDVQPQYLTFNESATALKDGAIDAAIISVGYPAAAVLEATTTGGARLLAMEPDRIRSNSGGDLMRLAGAVTVPGLTGTPRSVGLFGSLRACVSLKAIDGCSLASSGTVPGGWRRFRASRSSRRSAASAPSSGLASPRARSSIASRISSVTQK